MTAAVESFPASEELGMVALTLKEGGHIWLAAASVYAVEKNPNEDFSMVKTVGEPIAVQESPEVVFLKIEDLQRANDERAKVRSVKQWLEFVNDNGIPVEMVPDDPQVVLESDPRWKAYAAQHPTAVGNQTLSDLVNTVEEAELTEEQKHEQEVDRRLMSFFEAQGEGAPVTAAEVVQAFPSLGRPVLSASLGRLVDSRVIEKTEVGGKGRWSLLPDGESMSVDLSGYEDPNGS